MTLPFNLDIIQWLVTITESFPPMMKNATHSFVTFGHTQQNKLNLLTLNQGI